MPLGLHVPLEVPFSLNIVIALIIQQVQNIRLFEFGAQSNVSTPTCIKRICFYNIFWRMNIAVFRCSLANDLLTLFKIFQYFEIYKRCQCS